VGLVVTIGLIAAASAIQQTGAPPARDDRLGRWNPVRADDLAGYKVYWRPTTSATWDHWRWVGDTTEAVLTDLVVDNALFGVAAVNRAGNESPVVFPAPGR
jgi:hypothetical protein